MLKNTTIIKIIREISLLLKHEIDVGELNHVGANLRNYDASEFGEFNRDLMEAAVKSRIILMEYKVSSDTLLEILRDGTQAILYKQLGTEIIPVFVRCKGKKLEYLTLDSSIPDNEVTSAPWFMVEGQIPVYVIFTYKNLVSDIETYYAGERVKPLARFFRLLSTEKKDILFILFYAIIIGLVGLVLPLGIQTTVELISGGVFFSSVYLLIGLVLVGVLVTGGLQVVQISLVEHLQRRIFAKAAFEFTFRIPRLKLEALAGNYAPELMNRFFDILTIQKGLPKLLIDLSGATFQILFGLILLSLYHPFFVFFSLILVTLLVIIFATTGPRGLETSLQESKYKYKVVSWLEELARTIRSFKLAGYSTLPMNKTDTYVNGYLQYRKKHFGVLISQFSFILLFKTAVTGGLLIVGTLLVVEREINLGQFVASEIIIILILSSVEKLITYMDVVYDLLTAVDKISHVTDLPLDRSGGLDFPNSTLDKGYEIRVKDLAYTPTGAKEPILKGISFDLAAGESVCISGPEGSGKTTLIDILCGLNSSFEGIVAINRFSLRDLDLTHMRNRISRNISQDEIFDGTVLENITIGRQDISVEAVMRALEQTGLSDTINRLPKGLDTNLVSSGGGLSGTMLNRLILARCLASAPDLLILNDFFGHMKKSDRLEMLRAILGGLKKHTTIIVSNDPMIMTTCDKVLLMDGGQVIAYGPYESIIQDTRIKEILE